MDFINLQIHNFRNFHNFHNFLFLSIKIPFIEFILFFIYFIPQQTQDFYFILKLHSFVFTQFWQHWFKPPTISTQSNPRAIQQTTNEMNRSHKVKCERNSHYRLTANTTIYIVVIGIITNYASNPLNRQGHTIIVPFSMTIILPANNDEATQCSSDRMRAMGKHSTVALLYSCRKVTCWWWRSLLI